MTPGITKGPCAGAGVPVRVSHGASLPGSWTCTSSCFAPGCIADQFIVCSGTFILPKCFHLSPQSQAPLFPPFYLDYGLPFPLPHYTSMRVFFFFLTHSSFNSFHYSSRTFVVETLSLFPPMPHQGSHYQYLGYGLLKPVLCVWM